MRDARASVTSLVRRWEALPPGAQLRRSYLASVLVLAAIHMALVVAFHRITVVRAVSYAVFEAIIVAGAVTLATQAERARRSQAARDSDDGGQP